MKSRPPSASAAWMRRPPSHAVLARRTTSSATAATPGWRSCVNSGRRPGRALFRISCLFRPWPARGEIVALTGHLAENELRGGLTFIERALGVEKAREFYEAESSTSQSELARRLGADGFPVQQSHISRMADAVRYLLPAIPTVLYGGLGRHQVERLSVMRKASERTWEQYAKGRSCRWTSTVSSKKCCRSSISRPTSFAAACAGRVDRSDVRAAGHRLRRARPGPDRIREPPPRPGQRPNPAIGAADIA